MNNARLPDAGGTILTSSSDLACLEISKKKMDEIFNTNRLKLIDQFAALQKRRGDHGTPGGS